MAETTKVALLAAQGMNSIMVRELLDSIEYIQVEEKAMGTGSALDYSPKDVDCVIISMPDEYHVTTATDALDKLHPTAKSHNRVMVVEMMGRYAGWIALHAGIAGSADVILLPEIPFDMESVYAKIREREARGRHFSIVVVAEGAAPKGGDRVIQREQEAGREVLLGGIADWVAKKITEGTGKETRSLVLGHLQRGGQPTAFDRLLSSRLGTAAVRLIEAGQFGKMVGLTDEGVHAVSLEMATRRMRTVPPDSDVLQTARDMNICLGD